MCSFRVKCNKCSVMMKKWCKISVLNDKLGEKNEKGGEGECE